MASKATIIKFQTTNKSQIKGKQGHSRTGACLSKGKCFHKNMPQSRKGR